MPARTPQSVREEQLNTLPGKRFVRWADGRYKNIFSKAVMKCRNDGHEWPASVGDLINAGNGCPKCAAKYVYSAQEREEQLNALAGKRFIQWDGEYRNKDSKAVMRCDTGHEWVASVSSLLNRGSGCPACAKHGFNPDSPATLYALRSRCGRHIKIGVTGNAERRFRELSRETPFEFSTVALLDGDGDHILDLEKVFHQNFESSGFSGFDGATEWLKFNPDILAIMRILGA